MSEFLAPLHFPFMQNAYLVAMVLAPGVAILSCFLVLKGWALMGDAASHATVPGVVGAWLLGWPYAIGGFLAAMACALLVGFIAENSRLKQDTVMGIVFSGMFAAGVTAHVALGSGLHLDHILYGNMLGVTPEVLGWTALVALSVAAVLVLKWRDFLLHAFDPVQARAVGLRTGVLHYGLLVMLSAMIVATLASVGMVLAIGLLIAPGAIAFLVTRRFAAMMAVAVAVCMASMLAGVHASFFLDSAPAATIILILTAVFVAVFGWRQWRDRRVAG